MSNKPLGPVVLDIDGTSLSQEDSELLCHPQVGGIILFSRNYDEPSQLRELVSSIRRLRSGLVISVDHEGGRVQRFKSGFTHLPPMQKVGEAYLKDKTQAIHLARKLGWLMAAELISFDIDMSFAPVLDVDDEFSSIIGDRSFSSSPVNVVALGEAFVGGMNEAGMRATGKHFPGHGSVREDSHLELPVDRRTLGEIEMQDLLPFLKLGSILDALMPAHILFPEVDDHAVGFSQVWLKQYLRGKLGFKGLIFSDDLSMKGAESVGTFSDRARLALEAGCDAVLVCNNRQGAIEVVECLEGRVTRTMSGIRARVPLEVMKLDGSRKVDLIEKDPRWRLATHELELWQQ